MSGMYFASGGVALSHFNLFQDNPLLALDNPNINQIPEPHSRIEYLVLRAKNGEREAFDLIYSEFVSQIYRYIYLRVRHVEQAEDLAQEVFLKAWHNIGSYRYEGKSFVSWLFRIARNLIVDYYRQTNKKQCVPLKDTVISSEDPAMAAEERMGISKINRAIDELPPRQKEVISLRFVAELSVAETAQVTGISEGSVKKLQHEAMLKLRAQMEKDSHNTPTRVSGLFLDYDGTISPLNGHQNRGSISPQLERLLFEMRENISISIFTAKELSFIIPRTRFAHAWSAVAGLEMKTGHYSLVSKKAKKALPALLQALTYSEQNVKFGVTIDVKYDFQDQPLAFCIDWRQSKYWGPAGLMANRILAYCKKLPLKIVEHPGKSYFEVYPCAINKGKVVRKLKDILKIFGGILYMGDSVTDNPAFREADISIGVSEDKRPTHLDCRYWIRFDEVTPFLNSLNENHLTFSPELPGIRSNT